MKIDTGWIIINYLAEIVQFKLLTLKINVPLLDLRKVLSPADEARPGLTVEWQQISCLLMIRFLIGWSYDRRCWDVSLLSKKMNFFAPLLCLFSRLGCLHFIFHVFTRTFPFSVSQKDTHLCDSPCPFVRVSGLLQRNYPGLTVPRFVPKCLSLKGKKQEKPLPWTPVCPSVWGICISWWFFPRGPRLSFQSVMQTSHLTALFIVPLIISSWSMLR